MAGLTLNIQCVDDTRVRARADVVLPACVQPSTVAAVGAALPTATLAVQLAAPILRPATLPLLVALLQCVCHACSAPRCGAAALQDIVTQTRTPRLHWFVHLQKVARRLAGLHVCRTCGAPQYARLRVARVHGAAWTITHDAPLAAAAAQAGTTPAATGSSRHDDVLRTTMNWRLLPDDMAAILTHVQPATWEVLLSLPSMHGAAAVGARVTAACVFQTQLLLPSCWLPAAPAAASAGVSVFPTGLAKLLRHVLACNTALAQAQQQHQHTVHASRTVPTMPPEPVVAAWDALQAAASALADARANLAMCKYDIAGGRGDAPSVLNGKSGMLRRHGVGKRVNSCARAVVVPHSDDVWVLWLPVRLATRLTIPLHVTPATAAAASAAIQRGADTVGGASVVWIPHADADEPQKRQKRRCVWLAALDAPARAQLAHAVVAHCATTHVIVERYVRDGDWLLLNRQPSLDAAHLVGVTAKLVTGAAFGVAATLAPVAGGDFDGDEFTVHVPQDVRATAEAACLVHAPAAAAAALGCVQEGIVGAYMASSLDARLDADTFGRWMGAALRYAHTGRRVSQATDVTDGPTLQHAAVCRLPPPALLKPCVAWTGLQGYALLLHEDVEVTSDTDVEAIMAGSAVCMRRGTLATVGHAGLNAALLGAAGAWKTAVFGRHGGAAVWAAARWLSDAQRLGEQWLAVVQPLHMGWAALTVPLPARPPPAAPAAWRTHGWWAAVAAGSKGSVSALTHAAVWGCIPSLPASPAAWPSHALVHTAQHKFRAGPCAPLRDAASAAWHDVTQCIQNSSYGRGVTVRAALGLAHAARAGLAASFACIQRVGYVARMLHFACDDIVVDACGALRRGARGRLLLPARVWHDVLRTASTAGGTHTAAAAAAWHDWHVPGTPVGAAAVGALLARISTDALKLFHYNADASCVARVDALRALVSARMPRRLGGCQVRVQLAVPTLVSACAEAAWPSWGGRWRLPTPPPESSQVVQAAVTHWVCTSLADLLTDAGPSVRVCDNSVPAGCASLLPTVVSYSSARNNTATAAAALHEAAVAAYAAAAPSAWEHAAILHWAHVEPERRATLAAALALQPHEPLRVPTHVRQLARSWNSAEPHVVAASNVELPLSLACVDVNARWPAPESHVWRIQVWLHPKKLAAARMTAGAVAAALTAQLLPLAVVTATSLSCIHVSCCPLLRHRVAAFAVARCLPSLRVSGVRGIVACRTHATAAHITLHNVDALPNLLRMPGVLAGTVSSQDVALVLASQGVQAAVPVLARAYTTTLLPCSSNALSVPVWPPAVVLACVQLHSGHWTPLHPRHASTLHIPALSAAAVEKGSTLLLQAACDGSVHPVPHASLVQAGVTQTVLTGMAPPAVGTGGVTTIHSAVSTAVVMRPRPDPQHPHSGTPPPATLRVLPLPQPPWQIPVSTASHTPDTAAETSSSVGVWETLLRACGARMPVDSPACRRLLVLQWDWSTHALHGSASAAFGVPPVLAAALMQHHADGGSSACQPTGGVILRWHHTVWPRTAADAARWLRTAGVHPPASWVVCSCLPANAAVEPAAGSMSAGTPVVVRGGRFDGLHGRVFASRAEDAREGCAAGKQVAVAVDAVTRAAMRRVQQPLSAWHASEDNNKEDDAVFVCAQEHVVAASVQAQVQSTREAGRRAADTSTRDRIRVHTPERSCGVQWELHDTLDVQRQSACLTRGSYSAEALFHVGDGVRVRARVVHVSACPPVPLPACHVIRGSDADVVALAQMRHSRQPLPASAVAPPPTARASAACTLPVNAHATRVVYRRKMCYPAAAAAAPARRDTATWWHTLPSATWHVHTSWGGVHAQHAVTAACSRPLAPHAAAVQCVWDVSTCPLLPYQHVAASAQALAASVTLWTRALTQCTPASSL